ncbi:AAA family ATPase [Pseudomonas sp. sp1636]|uniref:AAA family ATPase n=1 Tax=Pseudomonas sp. sp1636 TaxID=3036707 RepID=UPI0025A5CCF3|nr:AAA family ATPase [Pseudomonas sp. sp1636]MDM8347675.1 AAA family ATPase [Pseudomonas sp. sp1636]
MDFNVSYAEVMSKSNMRSLVECAKAPINWMFEGLIENDRDKGHQWLITGEPKSGKSRLVMQLAMAAAAGGDFLGFKSTRKNKVLYFNFELAPAVIGRRTLEFFGSEEAVLRCEERLAVNSLWSAVDVNDPQWINYLKGLIEFADPDLVIWDVLRRMTNADENNNVEMSKVMRSIREINSQRTHIVVHHSKKELFDRNAGARGIRGASAIHAEVDGVISIAKIGNKHTLKFSVRAVPCLDELSLEADGVSFRLANAANSEVKKEGVDIGLAFKDVKHRSRKEMLAFVKEHMGLEESATDRKLDALVRVGKLIKEKKGREVVFRSGL